MTKKILIFGFFLLFTSNAFAQNTDSLIYESVRQLKSEQLQTRNLSRDNNKNLYKLSEQLSEIESLIIKDSKLSTKKRSQQYQEILNAIKTVKEDAVANYKTLERAQQRKFKNQVYLHMISWAIILFLIAALYITKTNSLDYLLSKVDLQATQNDEILKKASELKKIKKELKKFNKQIKKKKKKK